MDLELDPSCLLLMLLLLFEVEVVEMEGVENEHT